MGFFQNLFHKKNTTRSVLLIDIADNSVAGAYVCRPENERPSILYVERIPVERGAVEPHEHKIVSALRVLGDKIIREGAPLLGRATGSGAAGKIIVAVNAPWQEVHLRIKHYSADNPFLFTQNHIAGALQDALESPPGKMRVDEDIVGMALNGYPTRYPYGREAQHASVSTLVSHVERSVAEGVAATLRGLFHTENISLVAGSALRYQAMRGAFPHERNLYILDALATPMTLATVENGILVSMREIPEPAALIDEVKKLQAHFPSPRTAFVLGAESRAPELRQALSDAGITSTVAIIPGHFVGLARHVAPTPPDMNLLLATLYPQTTLA